MAVQENSIQYDAFISYRRIEPDRFVAERIYRLLIGFHVPIKLQKQGMPGRIGRIFWDREVLELAGDLDGALYDALAKSSCLILICSEETKFSQWVEKEVEMFIQLGKGEQIFVVLIEDLTADRLPRSLVSYLKSQGKFKEDGSVGWSGREIVLHAKKGQAVGYLGNLRAHESRIIAHVLGCSYEKMREALNLRDCLGFLQVAVMAIALIVVTLAYPLNVIGKYFETRWEVNRLESVVKQEKDIAHSYQKQFYNVMYELAFDIPSDLIDFHAAHPALLALLKENEQIFAQYLILDPKNKDILNLRALNFDGLGELSAALGDKTEATKYFDRALTIQKDLFKKITKDNLFIANSTGLTYDLFSRFFIAENEVIARDLLLDCVSLRREIFAVSNSKQNQLLLEGTYIRLASVLKDLGEFAGARDAATASLHLLEANFHDPTDELICLDLGNTLYLLASIEYFSDHLAEARDYCMQSISCLENYLKKRFSQPIYSSLTRDYFLMGDLLREKGELTRANLFYEKALKK